MRARITRAVVTKDDILKTSHFDPCFPCAPLSNLCGLSQVEPQPLNSVEVWSTTAERWDSRADDLAWASARVCVNLTWLHVGLGLGGLVKEVLSGQIRSPGLSTGAFSHMVLQFFSHAASVVIGALYPAFKTFKVIREGDYSQMKRWLKYWTVYAGFLAVDAVGDALLLPYIVPGYLLMKMSFLLWTASPWTDGASVVHRKLVAPLLTVYEQDIDEMLENIGRSFQRQASRLGNGALTKARLGLLSLATRDTPAISQTVFSSRDGPITVVVEEQAEEDVSRLIDEDTGIKKELEERQSNTSVGTSNRLERNYGHSDDVNAVKKGRKKSHVRKEGGAKERSHRTRRVTANRSISRGR
uniref:Receptor expression-enhancing protein n=1 Tax=Setaria digitata TaxID=48799 RepID=A0A915PK26_9BILA